MRHALRTERIEVLKAIPLFRTVSNKNLAAADSLVADDGAEPGELIVREGQPGREFFIIVSGEALVTLDGRMVARLGPGEFFGEVALLGRGHLRTATVMALTPMRLLVIDPRQFSTLLQMDGVAKSMLHEVVERLNPAVVQRPA